MRAKLIFHLTWVLNLSQSQFWKVSSQLQSAHGSQYNHPLLYSIIPQPAISAVTYHPQRLSLQHFQLLPVWVNPDLYPLADPPSGVVDGDTAEFGLAGRLAAADCLLLHSANEAATVHINKACLPRSESSATQGRKATKW